MVTFLHENGADINHRDYYGKTSLQEMIPYSCPIENKRKMAEHLISLGAKTQTRDCKDRSPLDTAKWMQGRSSEPDAYDPLIDLL